MSKDGHILDRVYVDVKKPIPTLPRYFAYVHSIADSPAYYSKGSLRSAERHCIFHYTLRGRGMCYNEYGRYETHAGEGFLSVVHDPASGYGYPCDGEGEWEFICFCFDGGHAVEIAEEMIRHYGPIYALPAECGILKELGHGTRWQSAPPLPPLENARYFFDLCSALIRSASSEQGEAFHSRVEGARRMIRTQVDSNPSVEQISRELGISREYLSRLFRSETGKALKDFIREERISRACYLLKETELSVADIADQMNFSSAGNFVRYFHNTMGMTPAVFRREGFLPEF